MKREIAYQLGKLAHEISYRLESALPKGRIMEKPSFSTIYCTLVEPQ